jgi:hypothetical protein
VVFILLRVAHRRATAITQTGLLLICTRHDATRESVASSKYPFTVKQKNAFLQINKENKLFNEGKATFFEELNSFSDLPKDVFENTKEGDLTKTGTRCELTMVNETYFQQQHELK